MDHDHLNKTLLEAYLPEFLQLFAPELWVEMVPGKLTFMSQELFTDVNNDESHVVDVLARATLRSNLDAFFLVHVEHQSSAELDFDERMFLYFAALFKKYRCPIYPIALLSFDRPKRPEPNQFLMKLPGLQVVYYRFQTIQLNRLDWREFIRTPNPVAAAMIVKMNVAPADRPRVRLEFVRMMRAINPGPGRRELLRRYHDSYLKLTAEEVAMYNREVEELNPKEREQVMDYIDSWEKTGIDKGILIGEKNGETRILLSQLGRLGRVDGKLAARIRGLPKKKITELTTALFDFKSIADVRKWMSLD